MEEPLDRYVVVGNPIQHSRSPTIHRLFADQMGTPISYEKELVPLAGFAEFAGSFARQGGCGMNITVPFKVDAYNFVDEVHARAKAAEAVNTILFSEQGSVGFNTDGVGLLVDLKQRHGVNMKGAKILMLGAGGAVQGVLEPLLDEAPAELVIANRTLLKAQKLCDKFSARFPQTRITASQYSDLGAGADVVINATSVGLSTTFDLLKAAVVNAAFCYDMSYGAAAKFHRWASSNGAGNSVDGLGMLVEQAAESFAIWRGERPQTQPVFDVLRSQLLEEGEVLNT